MATGADAADPGGGALDLESDTSLSGRPGIHRSRHRCGPSLACGHALATGSVSFDAHDPTGLAAFWAGVLGREIVGEASGALLPGDDTQVDVQDGRSGLKGLERVLTDIDQLAFVHLSAADVVRHQIVADIVAAYERDSKSRTSGLQTRPRKHAAAS